jgi:hypothetical protein
MVLCALFLSIMYLTAQPVEFPGHNVQLHPCGAFDGTDFHIVWEEFRGDGSDILSARLDGYSLNLLDSVPVVVSAAPRNQSNPAIVWNAPQFLCVWEDARNGGSDIYGARIDSTSVVLDPDGVAIRRANGIARLPQVAEDNLDFFVVWEETPADSESFICGARVAHDGSLRDTVPIRISRLPGRQANPSVTLGPGGDVFAVAWEQHTPADDSVHVLGARVSYTGVVIDTIPVRLCRVESRQTAPSIAFNFSYLVVWEDDRLSLPGVFGTELRQDFSITDTIGTRASRTSVTSSHPKVVSSNPQGNEWTIAWQEVESDGSMGIAAEWAGGPPVPGSPWLTVPGSDVIMPCCISDSLWLVGPVLGVVDPKNAETPASIIWTWQDISGISDRRVAPCVRSVLLRVTPSLARDRVNVSYSLGAPGAFALRVYDLTGKLVTTLREGNEAQGRVVWEPRGLCGGVYFIRLESAVGSETAKVILE